MNRKHKSAVAYTHTHTHTHTSNSLNALRGLGKRCLQWVSCQWPAWAGLESNAEAMLELGALHRQYPRERHLSGCWLPQRESSTTILTTILGGSADSLCKEFPRMTILVGLSWWKLLTTGSGYREAQIWRRTPTAIFTEPDYQKAVAVHG